MIFFTNAAEQQDWYPTYTFTGRTYLVDQALGGSLMQPNQWQNAIGLSPRIKPGDHPNEKATARRSTRSTTRVTAVDVGVGADRLRERAGDDRGDEPRRRPDRRASPPTR